MARRFRPALAALLVSCMVGWGMFGSGAARAQDYPSRPIFFVVKLLAEKPRQRIRARPHHEEDRPGRIVLRARGPEPTCPNRARRQQRGERRPKSTCHETPPFGLRPADLTPADQTLPQRIHYAASCEENATTHGRSERLLQA